MAKTLKAFVSEVDQPKPGDERRFKAKHVVKIDGPDYAQKDVEDTKKSTKKDTSRDADVKPGEDVLSYESMEFDDDILTEPTEEELTEADKRSLATRTWKRHATNAEDAHDDHLNNAQHYAGKIMAHLQKLNGIENPNWGHVGDAEYYHKRLKDIHDRMTGANEYAGSRPLKK